MKMHNRGVWEEGHESGVETEDSGEEIWKEDFVERRKWDLHEQKAAGGERSYGGEKLMTHWTE